MNHTQGHATAGGNQVKTTDGTLCLTMAAGMEQRIADAKRIALCLNSHDRLVAALKEAIGWNWFNSETIHSDVKNQIRSILEEIEGVK